jgi:photosystem II stability/assembly factor-like uncharacterized protein
MKKIIRFCISIVAAAFLLFPLFPGSAASLIPASPATIPAPPGESQPSAVAGPGMLRFRTQPRDTVTTLESATPDRMGVVKQFEETSFYINHTDFISPTLGWAVGLPHWDQAAGIYTGTLLKTTDAGESWITMTVGLAETLNGVSFADENNGWAVGTRGTIIHSADGGLSWVRQTVATQDEFRSVVFVNPSVGWAASVRINHYDQWGDPDDWRASLWHTSNGGLSWENQSLPEEAAILNQIDFVDANTGWTVGVKYIGDDPYGRPAHRAVIYHTANGGSTWTEQTYAAEEARITFTSVDFIDDLHGWVVGFHHVFAAPEGVIFRTQDGGQTWERQSPNQNLMDVQFIDAYRGYVVGFDYIGAQGPPVLRTQDGGTTWEKVLMRYTDLEGLYAVNVSEGRVVALGDHDFLATSNDPWGVYDPPYGENLFTQEYISVHYTFQDVFFADALHGWAVGSRSFLPEHSGQVIFHTSDAGQTWHKQYEQPPLLDSSSSHFRLDSVFFIDDQTGWATGMSTYDQNYDQRWAILFTDDGGQTWQEQGNELNVGLAPEFLDVQFLDSQLGWALEDGHYDPDTGEMTLYLAHTLDGGQNWAWVNTHIPGSLNVGYTLVQGALDMVDTQHAWAVGGLGEVIYSSDGGSSWITQTLTCDWPICDKRLFDVDFVDTQQGWIAGEGLYHTNNGGTQWEMLPMDYEVDFHDVQFLDQLHGWLAGDKGVILYTEDGGASWRLAVNPESSANLRGMYFTDAQQGWLVGENGTILMTAELPFETLFLPLVVR